MNRRISTHACLLPLTILALSVSALALDLPDGVNAQGVNVQITELNCDSNPEVVVISNLGDQAVDMTGWNLQSDPTSTESLPLATFGSLLPSQTIMVESGPAAEAAYTWDRDFVFRDNDPTDFAQLASDAGDVLLKVNCGSVSSQQTPTPGVTPVATAAPTATALDAGNVPVGGGPPAGNALISPTVLILAGSWLLAAGMATFAFPLLRRRSHEPEASDTQVLTQMAPESSPAEASSVAASASERSEFSVKAMDDRVSPRASTDSHQRQYLILAVVLLSMLSLFVFLLQFGEKKKE